MTDAKDMAIAKLTEWLENKVSTGSYIRYRFSAELRTVNRGFIDSIAYLERKLLKSNDCNKVSDSLQLQADSQLDH